MKIGDLFEESYSALTSNKVRTGLTMLGIVIGIGSVIAMVSIGQGAQGSIESNIQSIGSNLIIVMPGMQRGVGMSVSSGRGSAQSLTNEDAQAIGEKLGSVVKAVAPESSKRYQITAKGANTNTQVVGTTVDYPEVRKLTMAEGNFITDQQNRSMAKVAVLGPTTRDDLFGSSTTSVIGQSIRINQQEFKVIGVTTAKGGSGMTNQDDMIFIPLSTAQHYLTGSEYLSDIYVEAVSSEVMSIAQQEVSNLLLERHHISDSSQADFSVMNQSDIVSAASSVTSIFTMLLASIAGISLIVGGIGIMNMMLTTVTERTKEIGLRKAIGATSSDISSQFLTEAVMLTFLGGLLGIMFGYILSLLISKFMNTATSMSIQSVVLAFGVSAAIGVIFGYYPARRASRLSPIEALRFE
jgi:putative ABC transport system permease protein